jgi:hypothetical protein
VLGQEHLAHRPLPGIVAGHPGLHLGDQACCRSGDNAAGCSIHQLSGANVIQWSPISWWNAARLIRRLRSVDGKAIGVTWPPKPPVKVCTAPSRADRELGFFLKLARVSSRRASTAAQWHVVPLGSADRQARRSAWAQDTSASVFNLQHLANVNALISGLHYDRSGAT